MILLCGFNLSAGLMVYVQDYGFQGRRVIPEPSRFRSFFHADQHEHEAFRQHAYGQIRQGEHVVLHYLT